MRSNPRANLAFDYRVVRAIMAYHQIKPAQLAKAAVLSQNHLIKVLNGFPPGELAIIKIKQGLASLGVDNMVITIKEAQGKENAVSPM